MAAMATVLAMPKRRGRPRRETIPDVRKQQVRAAYLRVRMRMRVVEISRLMGKSERTIRDWIREALTYEECGTLAAEASRSA